jgi:hypothetical protein
MRPGSSGCCEISGKPVDATGAFACGSSHAAIGFSAQAQNDASTPMLGSRGNMLMPLRVGGVLS